MENKDKRIEERKMKEREKEKRVENEGLERT